MSVRAFSLQDLIVPRQPDGRTVSASRHALLGDKSWHEWSHRLIGAHLCVGFVCSREDWASSRHRPAWSHSLHSNCRFRQCCGASLHGSVAKRHAGGGPAPFTSKLCSELAHCRCLSRTRAARTLQSSHRCFLCIWNLLIARTIPPCCVFGRARMAALCTAPLCTRQTRVACAALRAHLCYLAAAA